MRLKKQSNRNQKHRGIFTFEWMMLITLLVIGIVGGVAAMRDAAVVKYAQAGGAIGSLNMSYSVPAYTSTTHSNLTAVEMANTSESVTVDVGTYSKTGG